LSKQPTHTLNKQKAASFFAGLSIVKATIVHFSFTIKSIHTTLTFWKVPQPTTKALTSWSTTPPFDTKKEKHINSTFDNFFLSTWNSVTNIGVCLYFPRHWHRTLYWQKLKQRQKRKNYGIWLWLQLDAFQWLIYGGLEQTNNALGVGPTSIRWLLNMCLSSMKED